MGNRELLHCFNAKVNGNIYCSKGHIFDWHEIPYTMNNSHLKKDICQHCKDYEPSFKQVITKTFLEKYGL